MEVPVNNPKVLQPRRSLLDLMDSQNKAAASTTTTTSTSSNEEREREQPQIKKEKIMDEREVRRMEGRQYILCYPEID